MACEGEVPKNKDEDKNEDESIKECISSNTEIIRKNIQHTDATKSSLHNIIAEIIERNSTTSTKSFIESEEDPGSFEKLVISACFSENVRKAFVAQSEDFINPRQDMNNTSIADTKITDEVERLQDRYLIITEGFQEHTETVKIGNAVGFTKPTKDIGPEHTDKELPLQEKLSNITECDRENVEIDVNKDSKDFIDPQANIGRCMVTNVNTSVEVDSLDCHELNKESNLTQHLSENESKDQNRHSKGQEVTTNKGNHLNRDKNMTEDMRAIDQEPPFTGCSPENKETTFDCNNEHFGKNRKGTESEDGLDEAHAARKDTTDSIIVENSVECLSNTIENEIDAPQDLPDKPQSTNEIQNFTEISSVRERTPFANEILFDTDPITQRDETALIENNIFTGRCLETEEADFLKHSIDSTELENDLACSSTKNEIEVTSDKDIHEKQQILSKNSEFHELHFTERDKHISKDITSFSESKCNLESLSPAHKLDMGQAISDKGQSFQEESAFTEYCSTEEKTGLSKERFDDHFNDSTPTHSCPDHKVDVGFSENRMSFKDLVENMLSSSIINQNGLEIDTCDTGSVLTEESVSDKGLLEIENIDMENEDEDTVDPGIDVPKITVITNEDLNMVKHIPDTQLPLSNESGFTGCYSERDETRCGKQKTSENDFLESLLIASSTDETDLNVNKNVADENSPSHEDSTFVQCFTTEYDGTSVVSDGDCMNDDKLVGDHEDDTSENVNECLFDANSLFTDHYSGSKINEETDEDIFEILSLDQESGFVEDNPLHEIESSSTRNDSNLTEDKKVFDNEKKLEEKRNIEMQETDKECEGFIQMPECFNIERQNETNECPFDIFKESIFYDTGNFSTDTKSDDELPDTCVGSVLYEIVSLPTKSVEEFFVDEDCHSDELSLHKDSAAFSGAFSEEERATGSSVNFEKQFSKETECVENNSFKESAQCLSDFCQDTTLDETFSYCKIDREGELGQRKASYDCFEEIDKDCCCQCCECIGNHD